MHRLAPLLLLLPGTAQAEERRFMTGSFDRIRVEGPLHVVVREGVPSQAVAQGDRRAIETVSVRVEGTTLVVAPDPGAWGGWPGKPPPTPTITLNARGLRSATLFGAGSLDVARLVGPNVDVTLTGSGTLSVAAMTGGALRASLTGSGALVLAGTAERASYRAFGTGTIDASALEVRDLTVSSQSSGEVRVRASQVARVSGTGPVALSGEAPCPGYAKIRC